MQLEKVKKIIFLSLLCVQISVFSYIRVSLASEKPEHPALKAAAEKAPQYPSPQDIQKALQNADYYHGKVDGVMGPGTERAIKDFQFENQLIVDGIMGQKTWDKLRVYYVKTKEEVNKLRSRERVASINEEGTQKFEDEEPAPLPKSTGYTLDLQQLIKKSKENIQDVNQKIKDQAVRKRNQMREEKAREYFEKANELFASGNYKEARVEWDKAVRITEHPEMKNYIRESPMVFRKKDAALKKEEVGRLQRMRVEETSRAETIEGAYETGVSLYKQKKFTAAKEEFSRVEELLPGHKATRSYLKIIEQDLLVEKDEIAKQEKKELEDQIKAEESEARLEKEQWQKRLSEEEKEREAKSALQAETVYQEAMLLHRNKNFVQAKEKFQEVEWILPNYKATQKYLATIDKTIKEEDQRIVAERQKEIEAEKIKAEQELLREAEARQKNLEDQKRAELRELTDKVDVIYEEAFKLFLDNKFVEAKQKFEEAQTMLPDYKSTQGYISRINEYLIKEEEKVQEEQRKAEARKIAEEKLAAEKAQKEEIKKLFDAASLQYDQALALHKEKKYEEAKVKFEEVEKIVQNFKSNKNYLARIDKDIVQEKERLANEKLKNLERAQQEEKLAREKAEQTRIRQEALAEKEAERQEKAEELAKVQAEKERIRQEAFAKKEAQRIAIEASRAQAEKTDQAEFVEKGSTRHEELAQKEAERKAIDDQISHVKSEIEKEHQAELAEKERMAQEKLAQRGEEERLTKQVDAIYREATRLYRKKDFDAARTKFEEVETTRGDYKSTKGYLSKIDSDIARDKERLANRARIDQLEERRNLFEITEKERLVILTAQVEPVYKEAIGLYKAREFASAQEKFTAIANVYPDYKATAKYLDRIDRDIAKNIENKPETETETVVVAATEKAPAIQKNNAEDKKRSRELTKEVTEIYNAAVLLYKNKKYPLAKETFVQVDKIIPGFKATQNYLTKIDDILAPVPETVDVVSPQKEDGVVSAEQDVAVQVVPEPVKTENVAVQEDQKIEVAKAEDLEKLALVEKRKQEKQKKAEENQLKKLAWQTEALGVTLLKAKKYPQAKEKFEESLRLNPNLKSSQKYLARVDALLVAPTEVAPPEIASAETVQATQELAAEIPSTPKKEVDPVKLEAQKQLIIKADEVYAKAYQLYKKKDYEQSLVVFKEFEQMLAENQFPEDYITKMRAKIRNDQNKMVEAQAKEAQLANKQKEREEQLAQKAEKIRLEKEEAVNRRIEKQKELEIAKAEKEKKAIEEKALKEEVEQIKMQQREELELARKEEARILEEEKLQKQEEEAFAKQQQEKLVLEEQKENEEIETTKRELELRDKTKETARLKSEAKYRKAIAAKEEERVRILSGAVDKVYLQALSHFKARNFVESQAKFKEVENVFPDFKETRDYLKKVEAQIIKNQKEDDLAAQKKQAEDLKNQRKEELSKRKEEEAQARAALAEKRVATKKQKEDDLKAKQVKAEEERIALLSARAEKQRLSAEKMAQEKAEVPVRIEEPKKPDVELLAKEKEFDQVEEKLIERKAELESEVKKRQDALESQREKVRQDLFSGVDSLYQEALASHGEKEFVQAKMIFQEIQEIVPDYKLTKSYLERIDQDILDREEELKKKPEPMPEPQIDDTDQDSDQDELVEPIQEDRSEEVQVAETPAPVQVEKVPEVVQSEQKKVLDDPARISYQQAKLLLKHGDYRSAQQVFNDIEKMSPDYQKTREYLKRTQAFIDREDRKLARQKEEEQLKTMEQDIRRTKLEAVADKKTDPKIIGTYNQAGLLLKQGEYKAAYELFSEVEKSSPDFQKTREYIQLSQKLLRKTEQKRDWEKQARLKREQNKQLDRQIRAKEEENRNLEKARLEKEKRLKQMVAFTRSLNNEVADIESEIQKGGSLKDIAVKQKKSVETKEQKEVEFKEKIAKMAEPKIEDPILQSYNQAKLLLKQGDYRSAHQFFSEVEKNRPNFEKTRDLIIQTEELIKKEDERFVKEEEQRQLDEIKRKILEPDPKTVAAYNQAKLLLAKGDYNTAKELFSEVEKTNPNYEQTREFLKNIERLIKKEEDRLVREEEQKQQEEIKRKAEETQKEALAAYGQAKLLLKNGDYKSAYQMFVVVEEKKPNFEKTREFLKQTQALIEKREPNVELKQEVTRALEVTAPAVHVEPQIAVGSQPAKIDEIRPKYDEARILFKEGEYKTAFQLFSEIETTSPDYQKTREFLKQSKTLIEKEDRRLVKQQEEEQVSEMRDAAQKAKLEASVELPPQMVKTNEAAMVYHKARNLFKKGEYKSAYKVFNDVEKISPNYQKTREYLKQTQAFIKKQEQRLAKEEAEVQAQEIREAVQKVELEELLKKKETENPQVVSTYEEARKLFAEGAYKSAYQLFVALERTNPNYKKTREYLKQTQDLIDKQQEKLVKQDEIRLKRERNEILAQEIKNREEESNHLQRAKVEKERKLREIDNFSEALNSQMESLEEEILRKKTEEIQLSKKSSKVAETKVKAEPEKKVKAPRKLKPNENAFQIAEEDYKDGLRLFYRRDYPGAQEKFEEIESLIPDYKRTRSYLIEIETLLSRISETPGTGSRQSMINSSLDLISPR